MKATTQLEHSTMVKGPAGSLYVTDGGSGTLPVLFLHSFGGSSEHWKAQLDHIRELTRGIAFDFRGHGRSNPPADNSYSAESLAADVTAVADHFSLDRFVLVGHSMGGVAAVCYAGMHPERVAGLVLAGTPGKSEPAMAKPIIESLESPKYDEVMDQYMKQLTTGTSEAWRNRLEADMKRLSRETSINVIKSMFAFDPLPALKKYRGPKLIVSTTREDQQPTSLHNQVPDVPYHAFENTSHWTMLDKPDEFNHLLDDFLQNLKQ